MQIAKIVPKIKTRSEGIFDYAIGPQLLPQIKVGLLVMVPFRGRNIEGIIVDIKRTSSIASLKEIISIIDTNVAISPIHIELARWMADYYISNFYKTLFLFIVPPATRAIKKIGDENILVPQTKPNSLGRKYLIVADFQARMKFYTKIIAKTLKENKQIIILVPDLALIEHFNQITKEEITVLSAEMTKTERWNAWNKIRQNQTKIIIGSNSAIFAPTPNLGLVILDQEENESYKTDQAPHYHTLRVAQELCKLTKSDLVIGSIAPRTETYFEAQKNSYLYKIKDSKNHNIDIINMNFERQILSQPLQEKMNLVLCENKKIMLVLNRTGEGSKITCVDCGWIYNCPDCALPLVPKNNEAVCRNCNKTYAFNGKCAKCLSENLKIVGLTTAKLEKLVSVTIDNAKIIRIEKDHDASPDGDWNMAIVTNYALKKNLNNIELVVIIDADSGLNFPGFRSLENNFQTLYKFLDLAPNGIIQTHLPESNWINALASFSYTKFYNHEISDREKYLFPPFTSITKLVYKNTDEKACHDEALKIKNELKIVIEQNKITHTLLGPNPSYNNKKRDIFYYEIIVKQFKKSLVFDAKLKNLPKGWTANVEVYDTN